MGLSYADLLRFCLGRDSGWRFTEAPAKSFNISLGDIVGLQSYDSAIRNPHNIEVTCTFRRVEIGVPARIEAAGLDQLQSMLPNLRNKVLTGPLGRSGVTSSDLEGFYASLSLGLSSDDNQNLTMVWFGDIAAGISTLLTPTGYPAFLTQVGMAAAVGIIPSGGSGMHLHRGYFSLGS